MMRCDRVAPTLVTLFVFLASLSLTVGASRAESPLAGGDDVLIVDDYAGNIGEGHLAMASDGTLFHAIDNAITMSSSIQHRIDIRRSLDGGTTWEDWSSILQTPWEYFTLHKMLLTEGNQPRIHLLYGSDPGLGADEVVLHAWADPQAASPVWTVNTVFSQSGIEFTQADLASDVSDYGDYFLYAVAIARTGSTEQNLHFARSVDAGNSWEASYALTFETGSTEAYYLNPHIAYGGGRVHLAFNYGDNCLGPTCINNSARTMYGVNFLGGGLGDWSGQYFHTTTSDPVDTWMRSLVADPASNEVYFLYLRDNFATNAFIRWSMDGGTSWAAGDSVGIPVDVYAERLFIDPSGTHLYLTGTVSSELSVCSQAPVVLDGIGNPKVFGPSACYSLGFPGIATQAPALAPDPNSVGAFGLAWSAQAYTCATDPPNPVGFDATWRTDPGYPNQEPGFPMVLDHNPATPPLIAQLDDDPYLEIAYSDTDGYVHLLEHDGTEAQGWPQYAGLIPSSGPVPSAAQVCAGDLNGDGQQALVVGNEDGEVWAWSAMGGAVLPGFPVDTGTGAPTYVAVGPVMAPWPRSIVACSETHVFVVNYRGELQRDFKLSSNIDLPPSIGDVDADGQPELLIPAGVQVYQLDPAAKVIEWVDDVTLYAIAAPLTLVDMDQNGEWEILVPTVNGWVHNYDPSGTNQWSYGNDTFDPVSRIAAADIIGSSQVEIVFTRYAQMYQLLYDGSSQGVYPRAASSGYLGNPVVESWVPGYAAATLAHSSAQQSWSWTNIGSDSPGFPKHLDEPTSLASAVGDIDDDGSNEIVVLSDGLLSIWDVNHPPQSQERRKWPMVGGDPGRTNCHLCQDAVVTAVDEPGLPTRLAFAAPYPNPSGGETSFAFALPAQAGVQIDVYDARGRKVRQLLRETRGAGEYVVHFDGRDANGRPLANGQYFARMSVRGGGLDQTLSRKLTLVR